MNDINPYRAPKVKGGNGQAIDDSKLAEFKKIKKEILLFAFVIGALLTFGGYSTLNSLQGAPEINGMARSVVLGIPLLLVGLLNVGSGIYMAVKFCNLSLNAFIAASMCILAYIIYFQMATGVMMINLAMILIYAIPFVALSRVSKAKYLLQKIDQQLPPLS